MPGVGETAAIDLKLLHEAALRAGRDKLAKRTVISSWTALLGYVRVALANEPREQFRVLFLDNKNQLIADEVMNHGTVDHAPVYPRELVTSVMTTYESYIRSRGFEVTVDIDDPIDEQLWDRDAVSRALLNLIDNAMKYSDDVKLLRVVLRQSEENVVIEVRDRGIGIDAADLQRIFDPYFRAQFSDTQTRRGAGLGLTLVQQIVVSHGGRIEVDSATGVGSTFRMLFPRGRTETQQAVPSFAHAPQAF